MEGPGGIRQTGTRRLSACLRVGALTACVTVGLQFVAGPVLAAEELSATPAGEPRGFVPGEAQSSAKTFVLGLSPGGGKPLEVTLGGSTARYQNRTANAQGAALNLGLLEIFLGESAQCGDRPPIIPDDQLPPITTGDSRRKNTTKTPLEVRMPGSATAPGPLAGTQIAAATPTPQTSNAATTTPRQDLGLLTFTGGSTSVTTRLAGGVREATAVSTGKKLTLLGGLIVINEPRWEAVARSGGTTTAEGRFTFSSASILGFTRSAEAFQGDFTGFAREISKILSGLGVHLDYPAITVEDGRVTVSPLVLGITDPPIGRGVIQPFLELVEPWRTEAAKAAIDKDCNNEAVLQVLDLALGVLSGSGAISLSIGGVEAMTAATEFPEPEPLVIPTSVPVPETTEPAVVESEQAFAPDEFIESDDDVADDISYDDATTLDEDYTISSDTLPSDADDGESEVADEAPATSEPASLAALPPTDLVSRRFEPGSRGGTAALVGGLSILGLLGLALADRVVMSRSSRKIPD